MAALCGVRVARCVISQNGGSAVWFGTSFDGRRMVVATAINGGCGLHGLPKYPR